MPNTSAFVLSNPACCFEPRLISIETVLVFHVVYAAAGISLPGSWEFQSPTSESWVPFTPANNDAILQAAKTGIMARLHYIIRMNRKIGSNRSRGNAYNN